MKKWKTPIIFAPILLAAAMTMTVYAGDINGPESSIIGAASGTFTYNGRTYVAGSEYLGMLQAKLAEDGVDLTQAQADELIGQMYASVGSGVNQGYLVPTDGGDSGTGQPSTEPDTSGSDNGNGNGSGTGDKKKPNNKNDKDKTDTDKPGSDTNEDGANAAGDGKDNSNSDTSDKNASASINSDDSKGDRDSKDSKDASNKSQKETDIAEKKKKPELLDDNVYTDTSKEEQDYIDSLIKNAEGTKGLTEKNDPSAINKENKGNSLTSILANKGPVAAIGVLIVLGIIVVILAIRKIRRSVKGSKIDVTNYIDMHSHILPGVDDGSKDIETTMKMVDIAYQQGTRKMIATPHYHIGHHKKSKVELEGILQNTQNMIHEKYPDFDLYLGNELFCSDGIIRRVEEGKALTLAGSRYVLVEFRTDESYRKIYEAATGFLRARYIPIIAHVERYKNVMDNPQNLKELKNAGALLQMNHASVKRHLKLIKNGDIDFLATDCHDAGHRTPEIKESLQHLGTICDSAQIKKMLVDNPECILQNKYI